MTVAEVAETLRRPFATGATSTTGVGGGVVLGAIAAFWMALVVAALPQELVQDSWLALLSGREVVQHGLPHVDALTAWTSGSQWIDQQWLGQVFYYGLAAIGGIRAVMLVHAAILVATVAVGLRAAHRLGAAPASVALGGVVVLSVAPWGMQMRTQDLGELFFVLLVALLAQDARAPSRRVYLALPLLVLWANIHGSVVLGSLLVAIRAAGLVLGSQRSRGRSMILLGGAAAAPFVSPYGFSLFGYYRHLLLNPALHSFIDEWGPSTPSMRTAAFYVVAVATIWALAQHGARQTVFARVALLVTLVGGVMSVRSIIWFGLCALIVLPALLDPYVERLEFARLAGLARPLAAATVVAVIATMAYAATRPAPWLLRAWPTAKADQIARLAHATGGGRVFADDRYADWLLWTDPQLRGRVAYDVRFELFTRRQLTLLASYRNRIGDDWRAATRGYSLIAFDPTLQRPVERGLLAHHRFRVVSASPRLVILQRVSAG